MESSLASIRIQRTEDCLKGNGWNGHAESSDMRPGDADKLIKSLCKKYQKVIFQEGLQTF